MIIVREKVTKGELMAFEQRVIDAFLAKQIHAPVHLSGGNEDDLLRIFKGVDDRDWVLSTWRSHYHALLKGIPAEELFQQILDGRSMYIMSEKHRFISSSIVGGILPIACGLAMGIKRNEGTERVWAFIGDMTALTGIWYETARYAAGHVLPLTIVVEDNGVSTNTPTREVWGGGCGAQNKYHYYKYTRIFPHVGIGQFVNFG